MMTLPTDPIARGSPESAEAPRRQDFRSNRRRLAGRE
jgi:hypothetical protein